ncbi:MAG: hypothetical protein AB1765_07860 [Candidatus Hydrogenedentota bacterium]
MGNRDYRDEIADRIFEEAKIGLKEAYQAIDITLEMIRLLVEDEVKKRGKAFLPRLGFFYKDLSLRKTRKDTYGKIFFSPSAKVTEYEMY